MHIDHTTIRTNEIEITKDFLLAVFNLKLGKRPASIENSIKGYWLYINEDPIIHIIQSRSLKSDFTYQSEAIDHTAFFMDEPYDDFFCRIKQMNVRYSTMDLADIGEKRIFFNTPTGILLETVFRNNNSTVI